jgi:phosphatidate phosphatase PAH1
MLKLSSLLFATGTLVLLSTGCAESDPDVAPVEEALVACQPIPTCNASLPSPGPARPFRNFGSWLTATLNASSVRHRGRDQLVVTGSPQWIIGRVSYGLFDSPITDEDVDIYVLRGCGSTWEKLDTVRTTAAGSHATVEGVPDTGGRVYYQIPAAKALGLGRHRVRLVVAGDLTATELYLEVVAPGTKIFVSDVDGTLTTSETEEVFAALMGVLPNANPDAASQYADLVALGYRPFYLTARAETLADRTRAFLAARGFPAGTVHTSLDGLGLVGAPAAAFKTGELVTLGERGLTPTIGFGNTDTDAAAYDQGGIAPANRRLFFRYSDAAHAGTRFENYADLDATLASLPLACQ